MIRAHGFDPILSALAIESHRLHAERDLAHSMREGADFLEVCLYWHAQAVVLTSQIRALESIKTKMRVARRKAKRAVYL